MAALSPVINALTIDVEDYFQVSAFEGEIRREDWDNLPSRVEQNTARILDILDQHGLRATFYVLGWVADRFPKLVRSIHRQGHEIGSHSYWHRLVYDLSPAQFRDDLRRSKRAIEDAIGTGISSFRAPSFSITSKSLWALEILAEEGFASDSSIFPVVHDRYGIPGAPRDMFRIETNSGGLAELPPSVSRMLGFNLPVSGGGYFRLYPFSMSRALLSRINSQQRPFVFYLHPWEIDADQPRLSHGTWLSRWRHRVNLGKTEERFIRLISQFRFGPVGDVIEKLGPPAESWIVNKSKLDLGPPCHSA